MNGTMAPVARLVGVTKAFRANVALKGVDLDLFPGQIHALVGENGAGKSTLVNLLTHQLTPDEGHVEIEGYPDMRSPGEAIDAGIAAVYQDRKLAPNLTGVENIFLGRETRRAGCLLQRNRMLESASRTIRELGFPERILRTQTGKLPIPEQEAVAIARALLREPRVLILDEPSQSLPVTERERLFDVLRGLRNRGLALLYITHALGELEHIADWLTALRDGQVVGRGPMIEFRREDVVQLVAGSQISLSAAEAVVLGAEILAVRELTLPKNRLSGVSLSVSAGEIVGLFGLEGSGRSELLRALAGLLPIQSGVASLNGKPLALESPVQSWRAGLAYVPRDRHLEGVIPRQSVRAQISLSRLSRFSSKGVLHQKEEERTVKAIGGVLRLRAQSYSAPIESLSGGNQQKTVLGRTLCAEAKLWLLDDPTAAIDVGSKAEIHRVLVEFAGKGCGVLLASSDPSELVQVCHRVLVFRDGVIVAEVKGANLKEEKLVGSQ